MNLAKTLLFVILTLCSLAARADYVQANGAWDDSGDPQTSFPVAFTTNVTAGNVMVAAVQFGNDITPTIADTLGSSWTLGQRCYNSGEGFGVLWYYAVVPSTGANTVTFSYSIATAFTRLAVIEETNVATVSPIDGNSCSATFFNVNTTDGITSGNFTPTVNNTRIIGIALLNAANTLTAGTNFTLHYGTTATRVWIETRTLATAASTASTFTMATGTSLGGAIGLAIEPAGAGSGSIPFIYRHQRQMKQ